MGVDDILWDPGTIDLSAYVNFAALKSVAEHHKCFSKAAIP